ncbi:MAG: nicotinate phosphoribosyltransferase, partial [Rhodospirillaceae bacterium]
MGTVKSTGVNADDVKSADVKSGTPSRPAEPRPRVDEISSLTDTYFNKTRAIVGKFGDTHVTYAVFMRRPVIAAPRLALEWLEAVAAARGASFDIDLRFEEGRWVGAGEPLMYISGSFHDLVDLETLYLQKLGA